MTERPPHTRDHRELAESGGRKRLTRIRDAYTLASTPEQGSDTDRLMITRFLTTLAEVALAVASRKLRAEKEGGE